MLLIIEVHHDRNRNYNLGTCITYRNLSCILATMKLYRVYRKVKLANPCHKIFTGKTLYLCAQEFSLCKYL